MLLLAVLLLAVESAGPNLTLSTAPRHVYKENDGRDGHGTTESFVFRLVIRSSAGRSPNPSAATIELRSGQRLVKSLRLTAEALAAIQEKPGRLSADSDAAYLLRLGFDEPVVEKIDAVLVRLETEAGAASLEVPAKTYQQKTKLNFPLRGDFLVVTGHVNAPQGHEERSQQFAYDVVALGKHLELLTGDGSRNEDFVGFGKDVLAPAAGTVVYARDDVPENPASGNQDIDKLLTLPDPPWGVGGNCVVIEHGTGEWSFLAHMRKGSVKVKKGDRVKQGDVVGQLGNSGATTGPHLHYHLMDGPRLLLSDGLPAHFENTNQPMPKPGVYCEAR
jgi:murein DD-endopeptidase MepM/ murein hydrolase activator NlpD